jgi:hypothetical protein
LDIWRVAPSGGPPERITNRNANIAYLAPIDARTLLYVSPAEDWSGPWLYALDLEKRTSRRISYGLEQYLSVAASGDGRRLVATVANPSAGLWKVAILDHPATEGARCFDSVSSKPITSKPSNDVGRSTGNNTGSISTANVPTRPPE